LCFFLVFGVGLICWLVVGDGLAVVTTGAAVVGTGSGVDCELAVTVWTDVSVLVAGTTGAEAVVLAGCAALACVRAWPCVRARALWCAARLDAGAELLGWLEELWSALTFELDVLPHPAAPRAAAAMMSNARFMRTSRFAGIHTVPRLVDARRREHSVGLRRSAGRAG